MPDPFAQFRTWFAEAERAEPNDPNAMALATASPEGRPSVRMVLLKEWDARGFVFYTNTESRKGGELNANPHAALLFHWKSLRRQVRIEGAVERVSDAEADVYYASRARLSRIGAWASEQSRPLPGRGALLKRVAKYEATYLGDQIPRPPFWTGFRVVPARLEFWQDMPFRLHDRIEFRRDATAQPWTKVRMYP